MTHRFSFAISQLTHGDALPAEINDCVVAQHVPDAVAGQYEELPVLGDLAHFHIGES